FVFASAKIAVGPHARTTSDFCMRYSRNSCNSPIAAASVLIDSSSMKITRLTSEGTNSHLCSSAFRIIPMTSVVGWLSSLSSFPSPLGRSRNVHSRTPTTAILKTMTSSLGNCKKFV
ncbi:hypothetical protein PFISCL1PPCAC_18259, partial [Pristionchus fissidentatus]